MVHTDAVKINLKHLNYMINDSITLCWFPNTKPSIIKIFLILEKWNFKNTALLQFKSNTLYVHFTAMEVHSQMSKGL